MTPQPAPIPIPPPAPETGWRLRMAESADEARQGTAPVLAATGLIVWSVQYFGFHGSLPGVVSGALYILVPSLIGWLSTHVAFKKVTL